MILFLLACGGGSVDTTATTPLQPTATTFPIVQCDGAQPVLDTAGNPSGYVQCPDGTYERVEALACDPAQLPAGDCPITGSACETDADCTDQPDGRCIFEASIGGYATFDSCACQYPCSTDGDCGYGEICLCHGTLDHSPPVAQCVPSTCATGANCSSGACGVTSLDVCGIKTLAAGACRTEDDTCQTDADCGNGNCFAGPAGWSCSQFTCGR